MKPVDTRSILKKLRADDEHSESANITFRLPKELLAEFKSACEKENVKPNAVALELIKQFVEGIKR
ncbi:MAG: hypothetical protein J0M15_10000 [Deltaproteobacteria bacterium]|jgi:hypothetical protein|nr:hypothetical protein [Deltaproteobacteria bacterium]